MLYCTARNIHFTYSLILFFFFRFGFLMTKVSKPAFHDRMFGRPLHGPHLSLRSSGEELAVLWPPEPSRARRILVPSLPIHPPPVVKQLCEYMNNVHCTVVDKSDVKKHATSPLHFQNIVGTATEQSVNLPEHPGNGKD